VYLDSNADEGLTVLEHVPLGHKVALADLVAEERVIEYGVQIAVTRVPIGRGQLVHTHNIRSARWQNSVA
jgi:(2R)-sulfolactate sulfo-lyase subunit alpha